MFVSGSGENGLMVLYDERTSYDVQAGGVLDLWGFGRAALGRQEWARTLRVELRENKQEPLGAAGIRVLKPEVKALIRNFHIQACMVIGSPPARGDSDATKNEAWNLFYPGNPRNWAGTVHFKDAVWLCPVLNYYGDEWVYTWLIRRQFIQALEVAKGKVRPRPWPTLISEVGPDMLAALDALKTTPELVLDIETNMAKTIITAIGVGNGQIGVSVPWDSFQIAGQDAYERGIQDYAEGTAIRASIAELLAGPTPKVLHNAAFDIYNLEKNGLRVNGEIHDTLLAVHSVFPQYRKGLQTAVAMEVCVEPWKSLHKPPKVKKNLDRWLATPRETRVYNAKDVVATGWLRDAIKKRLA